MEMMDVPSFAKGLTPQMLIDLAKSKNIITKEQQADFKNRVGKDRTALAQFNEMVTKLMNHGSRTKVNHQHK